MDTPKRKSFWNTETKLWIAWFTFLALALAVNRICKGPGFVYFLVALAGFFTVFAFIEWIQQLFRMGAVAKASKSIGLDYTGYPTDDNVTPYRQLPLFRKTRLPFFRNFLAGRLDGMDLVITDYQFTANYSPHGNAKKFVIYKQTVVIFPQAARLLPDFQLFPKLGLWARGMMPNDELGSMNDRIAELEYHPDFRSNYKIESTDIKLLSKVFDQDVMQYFVNNPGWGIEVQNGDFLAYRLKCLKDPGSYPLMIAEVKQIMESLNSRAG